MKYFDIVVLIHRNNAENYIENKVVIITVIIITSACFLYFPSHFILEIKTNHNNSCKTAFPWLQLVLRFLQIALAFPVSISRVFCEQVLSIAGNHQKVYSPPRWGRFPVAVLPMSLVTEFLCFLLMPTQGWQSLTSRALRYILGVSSSVNGPVLPDKCNCCLAF